MKYVSMENGERVVTHAELTDVSIIYVNRHAESVNPRTSANTLNLRMRAPYVSITNANMET